MKKKIEIEFRALFDKEKYNFLMKFLTANGEDFGEDDKETYFFIFPDKLLKVVKNISEGSGKVVLKKGKIGKNLEIEEIEIPLHINEVERMAELFTALNLPVQIMHNKQKRHNFLYKEVELAVKYSEDWGYHVELETVINDSKDQEEVTRKIKAVAGELGLKLMTDQEQWEFTQRIEKEYREKEKP